MTIYNYIPGTARRLPLDYNLNILNTDYTGTTPLQDWADMVAGKELDVLTKGEILLVPKGILHEETATGTGIEINPVSDSAGYFAAIICEDPADRAKLQISNDTPDGPELYAFNLYSHSKLYDLATGLTSSHNMDGISPAVIHTRPGSPARPVGCTNNDILIPNMVAFDPGVQPPMVIFMIDGAGPLVDCAYDQTKTVDVGANVLFGAWAGFHNAASIYNSSFNGLYIGVVNAGDYDITCKNVVAQNSTGGAGNFYEDSTGTFIQVTPCDGCGLSFEADGYTLTESDGQGTDLSDDAVFAFTDDINGEAFTPGAWDRGGRCLCVFKHSVFGRSFASGLRLEALTHNTGEDNGKYSCYGRADK